MEEKHIACFKDVDKPLFLISEQYPGLWMEHVYDSVMLARLEPGYVHVAENAINLFLDRQRENGHIPFVVIDRNKRPDRTEDNIAGYSQIQECISFFTLALEVYEMNRNTYFLEKAYEAGKKWIAWLRAYRMTTGKGLIEMFVGYDTGHDNSGRLNGIAYKGNYSVEGVVQSADRRPPDDGITPILAVDMNCNFYGDTMALARMAEILGRDEEAWHFKQDAAEIKKKLFAYCYDEADAFFYDVDKNGHKRKYKSSTIFHPFLEKVLDKEEDRDTIDRIYNEHIKNPEEFWTPYPFPSMAINDPSARGHKEFNSWGYYTQGLIVLRCTRWMDDYGYGKDLDYVLGKWVEAWTEHYDDIKLAQEIDPVTGVPTKSSEWYSSCMLNYVYGVRRLGLL
ncbi:MAG: hypothetical protein IKL80_04520 [Clostridia bacterium]|nr:hypothetical protein [Clostridia bacterium]